MAATISQNVGELRNQISPTSHGKPLKKLRDRNNKVDLLTRELLISSTLVVAVLLIRAFEERQVVAVPLLAAQCQCWTTDQANDHEACNNFGDESFSEFTIGDYNFTVSAVLFALDAQAYAVACKAFQELGDEPEEEAMGDTI